MISWPSSKKILNCERRYASRVRIMARDRLCGTLALPLQTYLELGVAANTESNFVTTNGERHDMTVNNLGATLAVHPVFLLLESTHQFKSIVANLDDHTFDVTPPANNLGAVM